VLDAMRLGERSVAFAMTSWRDRLYVAWTGTDLYLNVAWSPDGREITGKQRLPQQSYSTDGQERDALAPSLAGSGEHLYLAWTDTDHRINLLADPENPYGAPVRPEEARSDGDPALCSHQGSLILAWSGADRHLNLARLQ
jgi:hypothetical protein